MLWFHFKKRLLDIDFKSNDSNLNRSAQPELLDLLPNGAELRVWLPETLRLEMDRVTIFLDTTLSRYLREFFVVYLYGNHALIGMYKNKTGIFYKQPPQIFNDDQAVFSRSRSVEFIPGLGKNIVPLKLFLNEKLKTDLQVLADQANIPLSQFVREILVSHIMGHTVWPERQEILKGIQNSIASVWESGILETSIITNPSAKEESKIEGKLENIFL